MTAPVCRYDDCMSDVGVCESGGHQFQYDMIHNGFNDSAYGYCDLCGCTLLLSGWSPVSKKVHFQIHQPLESRLEPLLRPCPCGGRFRRSASPRCPACHIELSPINAKDYIEKNAPGAAAGWRWRQSWSGIYCLIIEGKLVSDWWDQEKVGSDLFRLVSSPNSKPRPGAPPKLWAGVERAH
jgi:hypothetical protein